MDKIESADKENNIHPQAFIDWNYVKLVREMTLGLLHPSGLRLSINHNKVTDKLLLETTQ